jgi:hypothetical protein
MKRQDNSRRSIEITREAEEKSFAFDFIPWVNEYELEEYWMSDPDIDCYSTRSMVSSL